MVNDGTVAELERKLSAILDKLQPVSPPTATAAPSPARASASSRAAGAPATPAAGGARCWSLVGAGAAWSSAVVVAMPLARKAVNELGLPLQYQDVIRQQAAEKHLDPALIAAVIYAETKFDARTSSAGAVGLMQILPADRPVPRAPVGRDHVHDRGSRRPAVNIAYGSYYLRYLLDHYHGNKVLAIAAYNGGEANVDSWVAEARARRARADDRRHPVPGDARLRAAGAAGAEGLPPHVRQPARLRLSARPHASAPAPGAAPPVARGEIGQQLRARAASPAPSSAVDAMYHGHGPITFSSELWTGLARRYM